MRNIFLFSLLILINFSVFSQTFEGWIVYKLEVMNPNPNKIPDSTWQKGVKDKLGERGHMLQKYYYKNENYISEIDAGKEKGFQAYNSKNKLLYSWQANSDTAITVDSRKYMDEIDKITYSDETDTILNIPCKSIFIKTKMGKMQLWYNSQYFKMDPKLFKGHTYGNWEQILKEIGCLPLKMEQKGFMSHVVQVAIDYKEIKIEDSKFDVPKFKKIIKNPIN